MKPEFTYVSLFSGIEACSVAMSRVREAVWKPVFFSEIDPFPCAVLAHHFPNVPNLGDICKIRVEERADPETNTKKKVITNGRTTVPFPRFGIDVLAGGSPCQSVSVAGLRHGMLEGSGTRSSLAFEYARLVGELRPRIILWENVPGVLSADRGLSFYDFLNTLVELGYSDLSYRVLDAQHTVVDGPEQDGYPHAVPQRRKRVWLVGLRPVGRAGAHVPVSAQILLERTCMPRNPPPRRTQRQTPAAPAGGGTPLDDRMVEGSSGFGETGQGYWQPGCQTLRADHQGISWPSNVAVAPCGAGVGGDRGGCGDDAGEDPGTPRAVGISIGGGEIAPSLIASDYKGPGNTQDGKMIVQPVSASDVVSIAKEGYNAGSAQNGSLGIGTDGAAPCIRADDHPTAVAGRTK